MLHWHCLGIAADVLILRLPVLCCCRLLGLRFAFGHTVLLSGPVPDPSWQTVLVSVSLFVTQYWLSGILEQPTLGQNLGNTSIPILDTILASYALLNWALFDRTKQGIGMAALTAVCGPAIEMFLISKIGLYHYSHPVVLGVPTWIPWVYYCGGPAVGNLGRRVWHDLAVQHTQEQQQ
eukprot:GHRR01022302.1.p2 GENE.GHRR01022302.1~~GHRR01022302.1.p2  ORF type:complete len:178 (+),score=39.72 GHRR01022302.1:1295-1828(+)